MRANAFTEYELDFLKNNYPSKGREYCALKLGRTNASIRGKVSAMGLKINYDSEFFKEYQARAAKSKVGVKRPEHSSVMKEKAKNGTLIIPKNDPKDLSRRMKEYLKNNEHPKGFLDRKHSDESKKIMGEKSKKHWVETPLEVKSKHILKGLKVKWENGTLLSKRTKCSWKQGWYEVGERRIYLRSRWEFHYALYLDWLKNNGEIQEWEYEPDIFWFESIKRGVRSYTPDFKVTENSGDIVYHEVKGWMDARSKTKLKRMAKYYPNVKLLLIDSKAYKQLVSKYSKLLGFI